MRSPSPPPDHSPGRREGKDDREEEEEEEDYLTMPLEELESRLPARTPKQSPAPAPAPSGPRHLLEAQARQRGLATAIPADNKGFRLLAKMGYAPSTTAAAGGPWTPALEPGRGRGERPLNLAPPPVQLIRPIKRDRLGIGLHEQGEGEEAIPHGAHKRLAPEEEEAEAEALRQREREQQAQYRIRMNRGFEARRLEGWLRQGRKALQALDLRHGRPWHFLWPEGSKDLAAPVPTSGIVLAGDTEGAPSDDAIEADPDAGEEEAEDSDEEARQFASASPAQQWDMVHAELRGRYHYCHYCGDTFRDAEDLARHCPGWGYEEHEAL